LPLLFFSVGPPDHYKFCSPPHNTAIRFRYTILCRSGLVNGTDRLTPCCSVPLFLLKLIPPPRREFFFGKFSVSWMNPFLGLINPSFFPSLCLFLTTPDFLIGKAHPALPSLQSNTDSSSFGTRGFSYFAAPFLIVAKRDRGAFSGFPFLSPEGTFNTTFKFLRSSISITVLPFHPHTVV